MMSSSNIDDAEQSRFVYWMNDFKILYERDNYIRFFPTKNMTRIEQLNALARFSIYLTILFMLMDRMDEWLYIPLIIIIINIILYNLFEIDEKGKTTELNRIRNIENKFFLNDQDKGINRNGETNKKTIDPTKYSLETGYYDSNGNLISDPYNGPNQMKDEINKTYSLDEYREYVKNNCMRPTEDNPMMNLNVSHMNQDNIPVKCNLMDPLIEQEIVDAFNKNLIRDANELLETKNSQRQFMPLNNNIPNDQEAFAKWCYGAPDACKVDPMICIRSNDMLGMYNSR